MSSYTSLIARGIEITEPVWVEPYPDASGLGEITTVSMPVYDRSSGTPFLIAVVGMDI